MIKNRVEERIEQAVVQMAIDNPALGQVRVSNELRKKGILVSPGGVRSIWLRHDMETFQKRLKALSTKVEQEGIVLDENQVAALEKAKAEKQAHGEIETYYPGFLVAQDTYYVGYIKGVGHIYQQTVIDTYSKIGFAKLYDRKNALVAADMLNDRVVPFFEQHDLKLMRMLTDRGTEYCGNRETHEYELYLAIEDIDHSKIKAKSPQTNGICERFNRTVQNEFYAIAFRKKIYTSIEQLQADLDTWMNSYNTQRTHSGKYCFGKTPMQTFLEGIEVARRYQLQDAGKIQPDEQLIGSSGCESENSCVSSQMVSDTFLSDSMENVRTSLDYYTITVGKPDAPFHIARLQHSAFVHGSDGGTECRGDYIEQPYQLHFVHPHVGGIGRHGNPAAPVHRDCCPFHRLCVIGRNVRLSCSQRRICRFQV